MTDTSSSILNTTYVEQSRPYSQRELKYLHDKLYNELRLGTVYAYHKKCRHFYTTKINGRKEKEIQLKNDPDVGNCSVCWKLIKTDKQEREKARYMVDSYHEMFNYKVCPDKLTYDMIDVENIYYRWLYMYNANDKE